MGGLLQLFHIHRLKREYRILYGASKKAADESLQRQMSLIKAKRPGQSEEWYLKKIIYDLEKDRRR